MASKSAKARWSPIFLLLGLLLPVLYSLYTNGSLRLPNLLPIIKELTYEEPTSTAGLGPIISLSQHKTEEAARLRKALQRSNGKWDANHPRRKLLDGLKSYKQYGKGRAAELGSWRTKYSKLARSQRAFIDKTIDYTGKLNTVEDLMSRNADIAEAIVDYGLKFYGVSRNALDDYMDETKNTTANQKSTVMYALKHIVRDWTIEGLHEREPTFPCILEALQNEFPDDIGPETKRRVLVPGAALGRLAHEISALENIDVVTNEWSVAMNLAYRWLTSSTLANTTTIYPNVDWWSHRATTASLIRSLEFPDDAGMLRQSSVELAEGDFTSVLKPHDGTFDAVVTYFFIDTARNIVTYLETIHALLKPGGVWINFGPLLYGTNPSIQLSLDEVVAVAQGLGLQIEEPADECGSPTSSDSRLRSKLVPYNADTESLSRNAYLAQHWIARKKA